MLFLFPLAVRNIYLSTTSDNLNVFIIYQIILLSVCDLFWPVCTSCYIVTSILSHYLAWMILMGLITLREIRSCTSSRFLYEVKLKGIWLLPKFIYIYHPTIYVLFISIQTLWKSSIWWYLKNYRTRVLISLFTSSYKKSLL